MTKKMMKIMDMMRVIINTALLSSLAMLNQVFLINSKSISPLKLMISHYEIMGPTSPSGSTQRPVNICHSGKVDGHRRGIESTRHEYYSYKLPLEHIVKDA